MNVTVWDGLTRPSAGPGGVVVTALGLGDVFCDLSEWRVSDSRERVASGSWLSLSRANDTRTSTDIDNIIAATLHYNGQETAGEAR